MKLYRIFSVTKKGRIAEWLFDGERERTKEEYGNMIQNYDKLDKVERSFAEQGIDEIFLFDEVCELQEKIESALGWTVNVIEVDLPVLRYPALLRRKICPYWFKSCFLSVSFPVIIFMP